MSLLDDAEAAAATAMELVTSPKRAIGTAADYYASHPQVTGAARDAAQQVIDAPAAGMKAVGKSVAKGVARATEPMARASEHAANALEDLGKAALDAAKHQAAIGSAILAGLGALAIGAWAWSRKRS